MSQGLWVLVVVLLAASGFGAVRSVRDGRFREVARTDEPRTPRATLRPGTPRATPGPGTSRAATRHAPADNIAAGESTAYAGVLQDSGFAATLGERATLLQFSSAFCAPCRATRRTLTEVADVVPGVAHVEVDAEQHLELVRRVGVLRTPTTLILDESGDEVFRASGAPRKDVVLATLARTLEA